MNEATEINNRKRKAIDISDDEDDDSSESLVEESDNSDDEDGRPSSRDIRNVNETEQTTPQDRGQAGSSTGVHSLDGEQQTQTAPPSTKINPKTGKPHSEDNHFALCWTLNNYTDAAIAKIYAYAVKAKRCYIIFQYEIAPKTGTPHLQGYFYSHNSIKYRIAQELFGHVEVPINKSHGCHTNYASKTKTRDPAHPQFIELNPENRPMDQQEKGTHGHKGGTMELERWDHIKELTKTKTYWEIYEEMPDLAIKYAKALQAASKHYKELRKEPLMKAVFEEQTADHVWERPWQIQVLKHIEDNLQKWIPRIVLWISDPAGRCGKTTFCSYLKYKYPGKVDYLEPLKHGDLAKLIDDDMQIFLIDVQKRGVDTMPYTMLESIKNGFVASGKYEPEKKFLIKPIVIVFANSEPAYGEMIRDRLSVFSTETNEFVPY